VTIAAKVDKKWVQLPLRTIFAVIDPRSILEIPHVQAENILGLISFQGQIVLVFGKRGAPIKKIAIFAYKGEFFGFACEELIVKDMNAEKMLPEQLLEELLYATA
jgi:hypothetical protein